MRMATLLLAGVCTALPVLAQDPLKSHQCGQALAGLQAARSDPPEAGRLEALRQQATQACLGGTGDARRPSPVVQPPIAVKPPVIEVPQSRAPPVAGAPPPAPAIPRPAVLTTCDAGGCWDSEGRRLNRAGPVLVGPGGTCIASGSGVLCP